MTKTNPAANAAFNGAKSRLATFQSLAVTAATGASASDDTPAACRLSITKRFSAEAWYQTSEKPCQYPPLGLPPFSRSSAKMGGDVRRTEGGSPSRVLYSFAAVCPK